MHLEIVRGSPGACPLCGMALEPMQPSLGWEESPEFRDFSRRFRWTLPLWLSVLAIALFGDTVVPSFPPRHAVGWSSP